MDLFEFARPSLMSGKTLLFVHGFASSGRSGTARSLRVLMPEAEVIAPDLPVGPHEAIALLRRIVEERRPDVILGTSMGGMYAEQLYGIDRILVNPAFQLADTILKNNGLGRKEFHNPREDGQKDFLVTKGLLEEFREVSGQCFSGITTEELTRVFALFASRDTLVFTHDLTREHYPQCIGYDGEHSLNDSALLHSVLPVIQWIDDRQRGINRPTVLIAFDDVLRYRHNGETASAALKAVHFLAQRFEVQFVVSGDSDGWESMEEKRKWLAENIGVPAWDRVSLTTRKDLLLGDYLVDAHPDECRGEGFMGTLVPFGAPNFRDWEETMTYFARLCGEKR
jgi:predicted esterase YcpF (UPF0227 family)